MTLTGGEPLLQAEIYPLIESLMKNGMRVEIETNGSVALAELSDKPFRPAFTMDYKLPSSGMEEHMNTGNFSLLNKDDIVKFVVGDKADLERAAEIIEIYDLIGSCGIYFSPVFGRIEPEAIVEFMKERRLNNARLQLQLHKYIWDPNKRGV